MPLLNDLDIDRPARRLSISLGGDRLGVQIEASLDLAQKHRVGAARRRLEKRRLGDLGIGRQDVLQQAGIALRVGGRQRVDFSQRPEEHHQRLRAPRSVDHHPLRRHRRLDDPQLPGREIVPDAGFLEPGEDLVARRPQADADDREEGEARAAISRALRIRSAF
jgi:hypothetical protein